MKDTDGAATPTPPPAPRSGPGRTFVVLIALGGLVAGLLIAALVVLLSDGSEEAAGDTTSTTGPVTSTVAAETTTTTAPTTTVAPTTTAATTTTVVLTTTTAATATTTVLALPSFVTEGCVPYDPDNLALLERTESWLLYEVGSRSLASYETEDEALRGLAIAQNHTEQCSIGSENHGTEFWLGDSGNNVPVPGPEDCLAYDVTGLELRQVGSEWVLTDGPSRMIVLDSERDALAVLTLAETHSELCHMGRPCRDDRLCQNYWKYPTPVTLPSFVTEGCVPYDPDNLAIKEEGPLGKGLPGWLLYEVEGRRMALYETEDDALMGLAIAQNHTEQCLIGEDAPDEVEFWLGDSGNKVTMPRGEDCLAYDVTNLEIEQEGSFWFLMDRTSGSHMLRLASERDALAALTLAEAHTLHCFIGRPIDRERPELLHHYWR